MSCVWEPNVTKPLSLISLKSSHVTISILSKSSPPTSPEITNTVNGIPFSFSIGNATSYTVLSISSNEIHTHLSGNWPSSLNCPNSDGVAKYAPLSIRVSNCYSNVSSYTLYVVNSFD